MGFIFFAILLSIPFYFIWNALAPTYLSMLEPVYLHVPFWHCVGIFAVIAIVRAVIFPTPPSYPSWRWNYRKEKQ